MLNSNYQMMDTLHFFCRYLYICSINADFSSFYGQSHNIMLAH